MKKRNIPPRRTWRPAWLAALCLLGLMLQGCGVLVTAAAGLKRGEEAARQETGRATPRAAPHPAAVTAAASAADAGQPARPPGDPRSCEDGWWGCQERLTLMALFAKATYRHDLGRQRLTPHSPCLGMESRYGMPEGWRRWPGGQVTAGEAAVAGCIDSSTGLYAEVYMHEVSGRGAAALLEAPRIDEVVIAFRGTENDNGFQGVRDWATNLQVFVTGMEPAQFIEAKAYLAQVRDALVQRPDGTGARPRFFVTGHSLGGGLAQQAAYVEPLVDAAYAFNSTPVTNWSWSVLKNELRQPDPLIYRISHRREALGLVRRLSGHFITRPPRRVDIEMEFTQGSRVDLHEMAILTCHLLNEQGRRQDIPPEPSPAAASLRATITPQASRAFYCRPVQASFDICKGWRGEDSCMPSPSAALSISGFDGH